MPIVAINISPRLFDSVREMIAEGKYDTPEQFLEVAIFNQLALEKGKASGLDAANVGDAHNSSPPRASGPATSPASATSNGSKSKSGDDDRKAMEKALARLRDSDWQDNSLSAFAPPTEYFDGHIWGQVNRLLPLKIACRWLAVRAYSDGEWPRLRSISDDLADDAAAIGTGLELIDSSRKRKRDERLATGLPRRGNAASRDRFISQYIARTTRSGEIYPGAICQFGLARFEFDEIGLTPFGVELAKLSNPILDSPIDDAIATLSGQERSFFVDTIRSTVPVEKGDVQMVLDSATAGNTSPNDLLESVKSQMPKEWTDLAKRTHVAGVLARCADLGLIRRRWRGRNVTYELSEAARVGWLCDSPNGTKEAVV